jgi:hypothetical protein
VEVARWWGDYGILRAETHQFLVYADDNLLDVTINRSKFHSERN